MSDDLIGALWVAVWAAIDVAGTYHLAANSQYGAAWFVAAISIFTLILFARSLMRELTECRPMARLMR